MKPRSRTKSEKSFRFDSSRCRPRVANMEQVDPKSRAVHIAARRAKTDGIVKIQDINGKLVGTPFEQASERSSYNWKKYKPDLPEKMIKSRLMTPWDFPVFTRPFLKSVDLS